MILFIYFHGFEFKDILNGKGDRDGKMEKESDISAKWQMTEINVRVRFI